MGIGLVALQIVVASSTVTSSTVAVGLAETATDALELDDLPLSEEELALLEALDTETATVAPRAPWWPAPDADGRQRVARARIVEPVARTLTEAFDIAPTRVGTVRSGRRVAVHVDGVPIAPVVPYASQLWMRRDPRLTSSVVLSPSSRLADDARTSVGRLDLTMFSGPDVGAGADVSAVARTADRSAGVFAGAGYRGSSVGASGALYAGRRGATRIPTVTGIREASTAERNYGATLRGRIAPMDRVEFSGGLDLEVADDHEDRAGYGMGFLRAELLGDAANARFTFAHFDYRFVNGTARTERVDASGAWRLSSMVELFGGGSFALTSYDIDDASPPTRQHDQFEGFAGGRLDTARFDLELTTRWVDARTKGATDLQTSTPLFGGQATLDVIEPLAIRLSVAQGLTADPIIAWTNDAYERSVTAELGPLLRLEDLWVQMSVFASWLIDSPAFESTTGELARDDGHWIGFEATGQWSITEALTVAGVVAWTRPSEDDERQIDGVPSVRWYGSARYDLFEPDVYFTIFGRGASSPFAEVPARVVIEPWVDNDPLAASMRFGASAGLGLGNGLRLWATVENVLDEVVVNHDRNEPAAGVDLRVMLGWTP